MNTTFRLPPATHTRLPNGLTVVWVEHHEHPGFCMALQVPTGKFVDPPGLEGVADLTVALMEKGPESLPAKKYVDRLEHLGVSTFGEADDEHLVIGFRSLARFADTVVPLFWETVCTPRLDKDEFKRLKKEMVASIQSELVEPGSLVHRHFYADLYGKNHPAGLTPTVRSVRGVDLEDVRRFFSGCIGPEGSCLVVIGDVDVTARRAEWENLFGSWIRRPVVETLALSPAPPIASTRVRLVDKKDLTQATLTLGHAAPGELSEDRMLLGLANYILGGGNFSSRLMARLRSDFGKTYGVSSHIAWNREFGTFTIGTSTQNAGVAEALRAILDVYREFSDKGVTAEELVKAQQYSIGSLAFQLEGIGSVADKILWLHSLGKDGSYVEGFPQAVGRVTCDDVNGAIRRWLSSPGFVITAAGNKSEIASQLSEFGEVTSVPFRRDP